MSPPAPPCTPADTSGEVPRGNGPLTRSGSSPVGVWQVLMQVHAEVLGAIDVELRALHGLSVSEFDALVHLPPTGGLRHHELSERVILTRSALTRMIDRLVARGLVVREPINTDRRGVRICLTEEGRHVRRAAVRGNNKVVRRLVGDRLDATDAESLVRILQQLHSRIVEPAAVNQPEEGTRR